MTYMPKELQKIVGTRPIRPDGVDKVTGRANFGADMVMPGMLWGKVKRSPHAHARIMSINTEKARALPGVKAVVTWEDFPPIPSEEAFVGEGPMNFRDLSRNCMARDKVLYDGHAVARGCLLGVPARPRPAGRGGGGRWGAPTASRCSAPSSRRSARSRRGSAAALGS